MTMKPNDFEITTNPMCQQLIGTLHKAELEFAAVLIILWHQVNEHETWVPFSRADIAKLFGTNYSDADPRVKVWGRNPFWRPDPMGLLQAGYVEGWAPGLEEVDRKGTLTPKFFEAVSEEQERRLARETSRS